MAKLRLRLYTEDEQPLYVMELPLEAFRLNHVADQQIQFLCSLLPHDMYLKEESRRELPHSLDQLRTTRRNVEVNAIVIRRDGRPVPPSPITFDPPSEELERLRSQRNKLEREMKRLQEYIAEKEQQLTTRRKALDDLNGMYLQLQKDLEESQNENTRLSARINVLVESEVKSAQQIKEFRATIRKLKSGSSKEY